jgi:hypothetical protein
MAYHHRSRWRSIMKMKRYSIEELGFGTTFQRAVDRPDNQWLRSYGQRVQVCWRRIDCNSTQPSPSLSYQRNSLKLPSPFSLSLALSLWVYGGNWRNWISLCWTLNLTRIRCSSSCFTCIFQIHALLPNAITGLDV